MQYEQKNITIIKLLLKAQINVNKQDNKGWTPLHWVTLNHNFLLVQKLLINNADITISADDGKNALQLMIINQNLELIKLILANNSDENRIICKDKKILKSHLNPWLRLLVWNFLRQPEEISKYKLEIKTAYIKKTLQPQLYSQLEKSNSANANNKDNVKLLKTNKLPVVETKKRPELN